MEGLIVSLLLQSQANLNFGILKIQMAANTGVIGGMSSNWLQSVHQIPLIMVGVLVTTILYFIQFLAPLKSQWFRLGISLFFAGVITNIVSRIRFGYVLDYILFQLGSWTTPVFNFADIIQIVGLILIFIFQFNKDAFDTSYDKKLWISPAFQKRYIAQLVAVGSVMIFLFGSLGFVFVRLIGERFALVSTQKSGLLNDYFLFYGSSSLLFLILLFFLGRYLSGHVVRPILNFETYLRGLARGEYNIFFVEEDEFRYLEKLSDQVRDHLVDLNQKAERKK